MQQKYAVYLNRKALLFNNPQNIIPNSGNQKSFVGTDKHTIVQGFNWLTENSNEDACAIFEDLNFNSGIELLKTELKYIIAAGGVVQNQEGNLLFIERLGLWDLPKGKVEKNESVETAAEREIIEETGLVSLQNQEYLCDTFHIYRMKDSFILKKSVWYSFITSDNTPLIPQFEESITKAEWMKTKDLSEILNRTYPTIIQVMECYSAKNGFIIS
jgi:ADP-ribose pyrophosphatase YjhB (NUDIX family)